MRVITFATIRDFVKKHPASVVPFAEWYAKAKAAKWGNIQDIKKTFNSVDYAGNKRYVFNIGGNNYRLVAMIFFEVGHLYIRFVGTHGEYDKIDSSNV